VNVLSENVITQKKRAWSFAKSATKNYHKPKYEKCWECFKKTTDGKTVAQLSEILTLCKSVVWQKLSRLKKTVAVEANPRTCCISYCEEDPGSCIKAQNNWS